MEFFWTDLKHACRAALARPGFTLLVAATIALGIGANSAVFAVLDGVLWRPLPYRDPARLVFVWQTLPEHNVAELDPTPFDFTAWHAIRSFESLALISSDAYTLTGTDEPERVQGARVTASLMPTLGIAPRIGRSFRLEEDEDGSAPVAILSDGLWQRRYGGDATIVGKSIRVNGIQTTVVGVMAPGTFLPGPLAAQDDLWLPARLTASERANAISHNDMVVARLAGSVTLARARSEIDAFAMRLAADEPDSHRGIGARVVPLDEQTVRRVRPSLQVAAGGVALLLIVACANAMTLLIARAAGRRREMAVRTALGATRFRVLSLTVAESVVVSGLGGIAGLALGNWTLRLLVPLFAQSLPAAALINVNLRVVVFTAVLAAILGLTFGTASAFGWSEKTMDALKGSTRTTTDSSQSRLRGALVVLQIALAVLLMSTAGLMLHSVVRLSSVNPGFDPSNVLTFRLSLTGSAYSDGSSRVAFVRQLLDRLSHAPGLRRVDLTSSIPFGGSRGANGVEIEGRPVRRGDSIIIDQRYVTPGYFQTLRTAVAEGRALNATDDERAEPVVVVNRAMADRYLGGSRAIDRRVRVTAGSNEGVWCRIVGVVDNVRHISLDRDAVPEMYYPYAQAPVATFTVVARTAGDPADATRTVREAILAADPTLPMYDVRSMEDRIARSFAQTRATMLLLVVTATLAAALAAVAIYGSVWYSVSQRTPEIGVRMALGATRASVCAGILRSALAMAGVGASIGWLAVAGARPLVATFLFETPAADAGTLAAVAGALLAITTLACAVPAWKAMRVDPVVALRHE